MLVRYNEGMEKKSLSKKLIIHPLLFAVYPVFVLYAMNRDIANLTSTFIPLAITLGASVLLWTAASRFLFRGELKLTKGALLTSLIIVLFFSYGHVNSFLQQLRILGHFDKTWPFFGDVKVTKAGVQYAIGGLWLAIGIALFVGISQLKSGFAKLTAFLNMTGLGLILAAASLLFISSPNVKVEPESGKITNSSPGSIDELGYQPDIYFVVMDAYARADMLTKYYNYDNSEFLGFLSKNGFKVIDNSFSNYRWTFLSLSSTLNMKYVTYLTEQLGRTNKDRSVPYTMIRNSEVMAYLKSAGYKSYHFTSTWGATRENPFADRQITCGDSIFQNEFYRVLAESSFLVVFEGSAGENLARCHLNQLSKLGKIATAPGPKFVFAHFIPPHHPYLFDRHGNILSDADLSDQFDFQQNNWNNRQGYVEQLIFISSAMKQVISSVLKESAKPPIFLLVSDHGPQAPYADGELEFSIRHANFLAFHLPGKPPGFAEPFTSVNTFRVILKHYFGAELEPLENRAYWSQLKRPYQFEEVTPWQTAIK